MSSPTMHKLAILFFAAYIIFLTYPGMVPFNRVRPFILGMPFNLFWVTLWIVLGAVVLWALEQTRPHDDPEQ